MHTPQPISSSIAELLYRFYFPGHQRYALMRNGRSENIFYAPVVTEAPTPELVQRHLDKQLTLGAYSLDPDGNTSLLAFDIDGRPEDRDKVNNITKELARHLRDQHGIQPVIEFSGNKGYHVIIFLSEPAEASLVKGWGDQIVTALQLERRTTMSPHVEVYPRQGHITAEAPNGNLLKLPLGRHLRSGSMSYLCDEDLVELDDPLPELQRTYMLSDIAAAVPENTPIDIIAAIFGPRMGPGARNETFFHLCAYLARSGWEKEDVSELLNKLNDKYGPMDMQNLRALLQRTFYRQENHADLVYDLSVFELSPVEMQRLSDAVLNFSATPTILEAQRILGMKLTPLEKGRKIAEAILRHMENLGEYCQSNNYLYWLEREKGKLHSSKDAIGWRKVLYGLVRFIPSESIFVKASDDLTGMLWQKAPQRQIYTLSYWDKEICKLYIHLGGPWVYILDGNSSSRKAVYNGDNEVPVLFEEANNHHNFGNLLVGDTTAMSPWELLLGDVNFRSFEGIGGWENKELLKVWLTSVLFNEAMPTRALLSIVAPKASGKTTLARRLVRFFEGEESEVLAILSDKQDAFRAQISAHRVMCLDNLEKSGVRWLADDLNRTSTGAQTELRVLYTTNQTVTFRPNVFIILTGTEIPFRDDTVFSRILPVTLAPVENPLSESILQEQQSQRLAQAWRGMFDVLDETIREMNANPNPEMLSKHRLADFGLFASRIASASFLDRPRLIAGLRNLETAQQTIQSQHSPTLALWKLFTSGDPVGAARWRSGDELYRQLSEVSNSPGVHIRPPGNPTVMRRDIELLRTQFTDADLEWEDTPQPTGSTLRRYRYVGAGAPSLTAARAPASRLPADATAPHTIDLAR